MTSPSARRWWIRLHLRSRDLQDASIRQQHGATARGHQWWMWAIRRMIRP